jgi:adenylate cyclase
MSVPDSAQIADLARWLIDGAPGAERPENVVASVCERLVEAGVPLRRVGVFVRTLHPNIVGVRYIWRPGQPVDVMRAPRSIVESPEFRDNPIALVYETGRKLRRRLVDPESPRDFPILDDFLAEGITDYFVTPLRFLTAEIHAATWTTAAPHGFSEAEIAAIETIVPPLARLAEIYTLRRTAANLLNVYVGHDAGERILQGQVQRGDTTTLEAAIWLSDLRGFTALAGRLAPKALIDLLNATFDAQVPAIEKHGGEVLKFMGDAVLAIFPVSAGPRAACAAALSAAEEALAACASLDATIAASCRIGVGLHVGSVSYGNVGGENRLDFTCIGPAVNLAARLQGLAATEGWPIALSEDFARCLSRPMRALGSYMLKGLGEPVPAFAPAP